MFAAGKTSGGGGGTPIPAQQISRSLRFNSADTAYLNRTPSSSGNQQKFTFSYWFKRGTISAQQVMFGLNSASNEIFTIAFLSGDTLRVFARNGGTDVLNLTTTPVYRDPSAWYHIVVAIDTTQATSSNRALMYVNGVQITAFGTATYPAQNTNLAWNSSSYSHQIGREDTGNYLSGYMTEVNFINAQQLTPSSFGQTNAQTGVWEPIAYSGSYGTNGFYVNFSDNSNTTAATLGKDYSGNGNNWTPNNFSVTAGAGNDSLVDSPTSYGTDTGVGGTVRGNYATLNPLANSGNPLSNGNLDIGQALDQTTFSTIGMSTGKWYCELTLNSIINGANIGIASYRNPGNWLGASSSDYAYATNGLKYNAGGGSAYGATWTTGDTIGIAFDADAGTLVFYKNGVSQGTAFSGLTNSPYFFGWGGNSATGTFNFGQRPFAYTAPSGFKALCTQNLPTPTIGATTATQAGKYFNTITWSGTGSGSTRSLTGVGFQPDWVWTKSRSAGYDHQIYDAVRGAGSTKSISSNSSNSEAQGNVALYGYVSAFNSDGFTGTNGTDGSIPSAYYNQSGQTYVAWNWKESVTAGFDIVSYTGTGANRTVAHNLGVAPKMIIVKATNLTAFWQVYNADVGATKTMYLNATNAATTDSTSWNNTAPTSSVFTVGTNSDVNSNTYSYIAYLFAEVAGYSKFGSYTGNGSADGPFVYTGFRPAYVMVKSTSLTQPWVVKDKLRAANYNPQDGNLYPNLANAEDTTASVYIDLLSNGFKIRGDYAGINSGVSSYIFMAFAESPQKFSLAR